MRDFAKIRSITQNRMLADGPIIAQMVEMQRRYKGAYSLPLTNTEHKESLPPLMPFLIAEAIDAPAMRAASVRPMIEVPCLDWYDPVHNKRTRNTRKAIAAFEMSSGWAKLGIRRWFRHLSAYAEAVVVVTTDSKNQCPVIQVRDPLGTYPEPKRPEDPSPPCNVAFVYEMSAYEVRETFPQAKMEMGGPVMEVPGAFAELWLLAEWIDHEDIVVGLMGPKYPTECATYNAKLGTPMWLMLSASDNRVGYVPGVVGKRVTLDQITSHLAHSMGMADLAERLMALQTVAQEKAIFPDTYLIGVPNGSPRVVSNGGAWVDGRTGQVNILEDVHSIGQLRQTPDVQTSPLIDHIERDFRAGTGLSGQYQGEVGTLRTGRAQQNMMDVAVDSRIQELHEITEAHLPHVYRALLDTAKVYYGRKQFSMYSGWASDREITRFVPKEDFEVTMVAVNYAIPGAGIQETTVTLGQMYGVKAISLDDLRRKHPYIDDADLTAEKVRMEEAETMAMTQVAQMIQQGAPPVITAAIMRMVIKEGKMWHEALLEVENMLRQLQAQQPPQDPNTSPQMMPGLQGPASPIAQLPPGQGLPDQIPPPTGSQTDFRHLVSALRAGQ